MLTRILKTNAQDLLLLEMRRQVPATAGWRGYFACLFILVILKTVQPLFAIQYRTWEDLFHIHFIGFGMGLPCYEEHKPSCTRSNNKTFQGPIHQILEAMCGSKGSSWLTFYSCWNRSAPDDAIHMWISHYSRENPGTLPSRLASDLGLPAHALLHLATQEKSSKQAKCCLFTSRMFARITSSQHTSYATDVALSLQQRLGAITC